MGLRLIRVSLHMFIPPHFHLCICYWGDGSKAHLRTAAKVWRQLCLRHNVAFIYVPELENVNSRMSSYTHRFEDPRGTFLTQQGWVSHLLASCRADWRSAIWFLTEQLERIWISGNLKLCYYSCGHIYCRENCMNWRQRGKQNAKLCYSDLSMGNQALETSWAGPFRGYCASRTHPWKGFQHTKLTDTQPSFHGSHWTEFPLAFGAQLGLWALCKRIGQTLKPESRESVGFRYFIWISFFPSSQHSCWDVKSRILIDTLCLTRSFRTANIHFTR